jgi:hypothetical protein
MYGIFAKAARIAEGQNKPEIPIINVAKTK